MGDGDGDGGGDVDGEEGVKFTVINYPLEESGSY